MKLKLRQSTFHTQRSHSDVKYFHILQYFGDIEQSSVYILLFITASFIIDAITLIFIITSDRAIVRGQRQYIRFISIVVYRS